MIRLLAAHRPIKYKPIGPRGTTAPSSAPTVLRIDPLLLNAVNVEAHGGSACFI